MNEEYVTYSQAVKLKELGFDWECDHFWQKEFTYNEKMVLRQASADDFNHDDWYVPHYSAPRLDQAQKWLREVKGISVEPVCNMVKQWNVNVCDINNFGEALWANIGLESYELALSAGIDAVLKILEEKK